MRSTIIFVVLAGAAAIAFAAADWGSAERKAQDFKREQDELRKLTPEETRTIVNAICEAEEADRQSAGKAAAERVKDKIEDEYEDLEELKNQAVKELDAVLDDSALKDRHAKAKEHRSKVLELWASVERMTRSLRGANHPVVAFTIKEGQAAHKDYQKNKCDVSGFRMSSGEADCLVADECLVIELKPNNRRAVKKGHNQAEQYAGELNKNEKTRQKLIDTDSDFASCKTFNTRVDCYKLCPDIDQGTNEHESTRASWDEGC